MSHSFYAGGIESLTYGDVLSSVGDAPPGDGRLRCVEGDIAALVGAWAEHGYLHFYWWGVSTRSVEVSFDEGVFNARVMVGSCPDDYRLALALVCAAARAAGTTVGGEGGPDGVAPDAVGDHWGEAWIAEHAASMARTVLGMVEASTTGEVMTMGGPVRPFALGPRVAARLRQGADADIEHRLFAMMRRLQYIAPEDDDGDGVYCARTMSMRREDTGREVRFAVWGPGVSYLIPPVELVTLVAAERMFIPVSAIDAVAPGRAEYLDDTHLLLSAVDAGDWDDVVAGARAHAVDPFAA